MQCRDNKMQKVITHNSRERRASRDQTFSAQRSSESRFGTHSSMVDPDDPRGMIRMYAAARRRKAPKITLAPMPWDDQPKEPQ
jgi:hypothetical protein